VIEEYKELINNTQSDLAERLEFIESRLQSSNLQRNELSKDLLDTHLSVSPLIGNNKTEEDTERQRARNEYQTIQTSLAICADASKSIFENVTAGQDSDQIIVSTMEDLISVSKIQKKGNSKAFLGQMSDESLQEIKQNTTLAKVKGHLSDI